MKQLQLTGSATERPKDTILFIETVKISAERILLVGTPSVEMLYPPHSVLIMLLYVV